MMPGVTYLPVPSITTASAGASIDVPTETIFPSRSRIDAFCIVGPAAVMIVALRISVVARRERDVRARERIRVRLRQRALARPAGGVRVGSRRARNAKPDGWMTQQQV